MRHRGWPIEVKIEFSGDWKRDTAPYIVRPIVVTLRIPETHPPLEIDWFRLIHSCSTPMPQRSLACRGVNPHYFKYPDRPKVVQPGAEAAFELHWLVSFTHQFGQPDLLLHQYVGCDTDVPCALVPGWVKTPDRPMPDGFPEPPAWNPHWVVCARHPITAESSGYDCGGVPRSR